MAIKWISYFLDEADLEDSELLLAIVIADHSDNDGLSYPSVTTIAKRLRKQVRQTQVLLNRLKVKGYLKIDRGTGRGHPNTYQLQRVHSTAPIREIKGVVDNTLSEQERVHSGAIKGAFCDTERVHSGALPLNKEESLRESLRNPYERGIKNQPLSLPTSVRSEVDALLAAAAPLVGAKSVRTLDDEFRWRKVAEKVVAEQHPVTDFLDAVRTEFDRCRGTPQYFTPEGCLKILQAKKAIGRPKFTHTV